MFLLKTCNYAYFKDVTHAPAFLPKHHTKDQDTLIEQSFIRIYVQFNPFVGRFPNGHAMLPKMCLLVALIKLYAKFFLIS